jgi:hypothetical protein
MQTLTLSENAVAVLRFEIKGWRAKNGPSRLPAYRELAVAGIMEPVPDSESEYRFTEEGTKCRQKVLEREEERIERERHEPPDTSHLSEAAWELLRRRADGEQVDVSPENLPAYRELVVARIMMPMSGFATGPESSFRFTYFGWDRRHEWLAHPAGSPARAL